MFDKYTIDAKRAVLFARLEASREGTPYVSTLQLLLGLVREEDSPVNQLFKLKVSEVTLRAGLSHGRDPIGTSVDLPMSNELQRALEYAEEEADSLKVKIVGSEHLLLGILRAGDQTASELEKIGLSLEMARQKIRSLPVTRPTGNVYFGPSPFLPDELK